MQLIHGRGACVVSAVLSFVVGSAAYAQDSTSLDQLLGSAPAKQSASQLEAASSTGAPAQPPAAAASAPSPASVAESDAPVSAAVESAAPKVSTEQPRRGSAIEEIIVTAEKREESINSIPIAVEAFSGKQLKNMGVTDTRDLGHLVPGFTYGDSGYGVPVYSIRGIGFNDPSETASSTVGIYVDGFDLPFPVFSKGGNIDLQRVEILKGPQGTLYGRNTTAGLVNYVTNKPTENFQAGITGSYERFGVYKADGFVSGPLIDTLSARLAYQRTYSGIGWQRSNTRYPDGFRDTLGKQNKQSGRFTLEWKPVEDFTTSLILSGWTDKSDPEAPQAIAITPQNAIAGQAALAPEVSGYPLVPYDTHNNRVADFSPNLDFHLGEKFGMAALRSDWKVADQTTLTFQGAYESFEINHSILPQTGLDSNNTEREMVDHSNADSFELRLAGRVTDDIDYLIGGFYSHDRVNSFNRIFVDSNSAVYPLPLAGPLLGLPEQLGLTGPLPTVGDLFTNRVDAEGIQSADSEAVYANGNWQFLPNFKLNLGVRYTAEQRKFFGCTRDDVTQSSGIGFSNAFDAVQIAQAVLHGAPLPTVLAQPGGCIEYDATTFNSGPFTGKLNEPNVSFRTALDWTPAEGLLFYASFSRGYKSGSFPVVAASTNDQYKPVTQEKLNAYEIGAKTALLDHRVQFNTSAFYYDYRNKQLYGVIYDQIFGPLPELVNAPKSKVEGVEAEVQISPLQGLFVSASATYLRTVIGNFSTLDARGNPQDLTGKPFNYTPRLSTTLVVNYTVPIADGYTFGIGGDYSYRSGTNSILTGDPRFVIDGYRLLDLHADLAASAGWTVSVFSRNVTNEFYSNGSINTGDTVARFAGYPRTFGVSASYQFGEPPQP